jgi:hypothetical protein
MLIDEFHNLSSCYSRWPPRAHIINRTSASLLLIVSPLPKLSSASCRYYQNKVSFFRKFHSFSHHLTTEIVPETAVVHWCSQSIKKPFQTYPNVTGTSRKWRQTKLIWRKFLFFIANIFHCFQRRFWYNQILLFLLFPSRNTSKLMNHLSNIQYQNKSRFM